MKTKIIAVRHGETEWNYAELQQGHLDSPLTENGINQAYGLAKGLLNRDIEIIYSSDLGRALQTAMIISNKLSLEIIKEPMLRERNLGIMQGLTKKDFEAKFPDEYKKLQSKDPDYVLPNGESARERYTRSVKCIETIANSNQGKTILVVTHGGILNGLFYKLTDTPLSQPKKVANINASINTFSITKNVWHLESWGEIGHLDGLRALDDN